MEYVCIAHKGKVKREILKKRTKKGCFTENGFYKTVRVYAYDGYSKKYRTCRIFYEEQKAIDFAFEQRWAEIDHHNQMVGRIINNSLKCY